jgi:[1-hydroxy-2-(trimethylamino)ethyl]phosphonate dioxygenase
MLELVPSKESALATFARVWFGRAGKASKLPLIRSLATSATSMIDRIVDDIRSLFERNGASLYGGEQVTQREHALQAAALAEASGADASLIAAALLHDVGHLLHDLPEDAPERGIDDVHEVLAYNWLSRFFPPEVTEPVGMHVAAKRYLCAVEPAYRNSLSATSLHSLQLQGGPLNVKEAQAFEQNQHFREGVCLRRWDDAAKVAGLPTPDLEHLLPYVAAARLEAIANSAS